MVSTTEAIYILARNLYDCLDIIPGAPIFKGYVKRSYQNDPIRVALEALLLIFAIMYMLNKKFNFNSNYVELTKQEIDELVEEWEPEPLVKESIETQPMSSNIIIKRFEGIEAILPDDTRLNTWSGSNFIGLHNNEEMRSKCVEVVNQYGVGTCGPSGFYGTIDIHLDLQKEISLALGTERAILYAQGYSTISSIIPAFSKKGDIIVADECVNFAIQRGLTLSKSAVHFFKHNDMEDLENVLKRIEIEQRKKRTPLTRRFIVTEGLFSNTGSIVPLPEIVSIKNKYKYRLILDESLSFGTLGDHCYGVTDFFGIASSQIDIIAGSLSNSLGSAGGFCAGDKNIDEHQVLFSQAYCFSASLPAFLTAAAITNLKILAKDGVFLSQKLNCIISVFRKHFSPYPPNMTLLGNSRSPLIYLTFTKKSGFDEREQGRIIDEIILEMRNVHEIILSQLNTIAVKDERCKYDPMIKITLSAAYDPIQTESFAKLLLSVSNKCIEKY